LCAWLQAAKELDKQSDKSDPDGWKKSFVAAMNHLTHRSAKGGSHGAKHEDDAATEAGTSVVSSHITAHTSTSQQRAEAAKQQRMEVESQGDVSEWDRSTCTSEVRRSRACGSVHPDDLLRENPDLKLVHSAMSVKALVARQEKCMESAQMCA
jgi:hypothetical protein